MAADQDANGDAGALFDDRWLITAAGCTPRGDLPYDCTLKGG